METERYTEVKTIMQVLAKGEKGKNQTRDKVTLHVDRDHQLVFVLPGDVVRGLIDDVHEDGGQVGHHEDAGDVQLQVEGDPDSFQPGVLEKFRLEFPFFYPVLSVYLGSLVYQVFHVELHQFVLISLKEEMHRTNIVAKRIFSNCGK